MIGGETVCSQRLIEEDASDLHVLTQSAASDLLAAKKACEREGKGKGRQRTPRKIAPTRLMVIDLWKHLA
jgi:hypothetical protein